MSSTVPGITTAERSLAPDIARGMMLLFIALANVPFYLYGRVSDGYGHIGDSSQLDTVLWGLEHLLIAERSRPMFAILYGFGMAMMASRFMARRIAQGADPGTARGAARALLAKRGAFLVILGGIHSMFLFLGDILAPYGITGLVALLFVVASDRAVKHWMIWTFVFVAVVTTPLMVALTALEPAAAGDTMDPEMGSSYLIQILYGIAASVTLVFFSGLFLYFVPLVAAGILLHRRGWLTAPGEHLRGLAITSTVGTAIGLASATPVALISWDLWEPDAFGYYAALWLTNVGGMAAGLAYVCLFALAAHGLRGVGRRGPVRVLASLGERSLTGYLLQSLIMAPLLAAWAGGLGDGMGYATAFGVALGTWAVTLGVAYALDRAGRRGPFEVLLRRLVYGRPTTATPVATPAATSVG